MTIQFHEHVTMTRTEYGAILLDQKQGKYWQLNPTATMVADALLAGRGVGEAMAEVMRKFDVDQQRAAADVTALVDGMRAAGVIRR